MRLDGINSVAHFVSQPDIILVGEGDMIGLLRSNLGNQAKEIARSTTVLAPLGQHGDTRLMLCQVGKPLLCAIIRSINTDNQ